jgi:DUF1009 family protein
LSGREKIGLVAGSGQLPRLFARAARAQGLGVVAVAHQGETDPSLSDEVDQLSWVRVGQLDRIRRCFVEAGVKRAVLAGGIGRVRSLHEARPDIGTLRVLARLKSFRDDELLRAVAADFEAVGVSIVAPTSFLKEVMAPEGHLCGPALSEGQQVDVELGVEVARRLGEVDVGQTVVVRNRHVLALEAVEGTDAAVARGCSLGGKGAVVVKLMKRGQDERFDLPAVGPGTVRTMAQGGARVLAVQAGKTLLLEAQDLFALAEKEGISVVGLSLPASS